MGLKIQDVVTAAGFSRRPVKAFKRKRKQSFQ
jgi:hypothetical protein